MTAGTWQFHDQDGFVLTDLAEPWLMQWSSMALNIPPRLDLLPRAGNMLGIMTKVKDPISGAISKKGTFIKGLEPEVKLRLKKGDQTAREILLAAGCKKSSLFTSPVKAAHPGGSAPIGKVVDTNLETKSLKNCFVADASVVPDQLGTPVVLLALSIGAYAADRILARWS
jgi:choline dehydrogenase-like flavoprotein